MSESIATVQTVLGPVPATALGHVQMHEHLLIDLWKGMPLGVADRDRRKYLEPVKLDNYYWSRRYHSQDDLRLSDYEVAIAELKMFGDAGGGTIVDVTSVGLGRDPAGLRVISRVAGVHVVMGCGYYVADYHPRPITSSDLDTITAEMVSDLTVGVNGTDIRAGIIGEIGLSWPPNIAELVVLEAAAQAHLETGIPISVHPGRNPLAPLHAIRLLGRWGVKPTAVVMCHIDRTLSAMSAIIELAETGCSVELDLFGQESSFYALAPEFHMPNDAGRADIIVKLIAAGHLEQLLISQDVCHKTNLVRYGGEGYGHVLSHVVPLLVAKGLESSHIWQITRENPLRVLTGGAT